MERLRQWIENPAQRRRGLVVLSGSLIFLALAARYVLGLAGPDAALLALAAVASGLDIAIRAWRSLRNRYASIELLVTIAASGALLIGEYWEAAAVTFLFILGGYLEARTLSRTRRALQELLDVAPATAVVLRGGQQVEVMPHEVAIGETVIVKPGTKIPVDGEVIDGRAAVDESAITGESLPVEKLEGASVFAGTLSQDGLLLVHASGIGAGTTLARIIRRVEEAQEEKAPAQQFIERFARWYTPGIIALSALTFLFTRDLDLALTLLVIGCPGALVISTPVSVVAGIGRAAQRGILIKGGQYLERAGKVTALALDKTGTLTLGKPQLTDVIALRPETAPAAEMAAGSRYPDLAPVALYPAASGRRPEAALRAFSGPASGAWSEMQVEVLRWAALAEAGSEHPLARPIVAAAQALGPIPPMDEFEQVSGRGVRAAYAGHRIAVGTPDLLIEAGVDVPEETQQTLAELRARGRTAVLVAVDGQTLGVLGMADRLRPDAASVLRELTALGIGRVAMLTGDDRRTAQAIAVEAGIGEVYANALPEDKLSTVRRWQSEGQVVAMVGDGINDAPALAAADISIAMGAAGTDVAIETADIALMADDLAKIPEAIRLSRATLRNIRQNLVVALVTVTALLLGVLLGDVHMAGGMLVHQASVLLVILNGMRLLRA